MMHPPDPTPIDPALAHTQRRFAQLDADTPTPQLDYVQRRRLLSELQARLLRTQPLPGIAIQQHFVSAPELRCAAFGANLRDLWHKVAQPLAQRLTDQQAITLRSVIRIAHPVAPTADE